MEVMMKAVMEDEEIVEGFKIALDRVSSYLTDKMLPACTVGPKY